MKQKNVEISVIICSYNRAKYIVEALKSLSDQSLSKARFEVIVVDNNSTDETETVCSVYMKENPDLQAIYLNETQQGSSFARNTGAKHAHGEFLVFMDDDAVANKNFLENILSFFESHPMAGGLGGRIIPLYIPFEPKWMSHYVSSLVGNFDYSSSLTTFSEDKYPLESNMAVRKLDFDSIGGFNENLPGVKGTLRIGGEGKDFFFRLKKLGKPIFYDPSVQVQHVVETSKLTREYMYRVASGIGRGERVRIREKGKIGFVLKMTEYLFKLGASFTLGLLYLLQGNPAKSLPIIQFRIDAIKGFIGF
jgi:glycosyltransferase involved in cell wall biosynthesis